MAKINGDLLFEIDQLKLSKYDLDDDLDNVEWFDDQRMPRANWDELIEEPF